MELRIKLKTHTETYYSRQTLENGISKLGCVSFCGFDNGAGYQGARTSLNSNSQNISFYSIQKHRAKKIRNKNGKYIVKNPSYWKLTITTIPRELFVHLGKHVVQYNKTWKIEEK